VSFHEIDDFLWESIEPYLPPQNRLEKFYYLYLDVLNIIIIITDAEYKSNTSSVKTLSIGNLDQHDRVMSKLDELVKYQHFASSE
jgi:hypothetical protein